MHPESRQGKTAPEQAGKLNVGHKEDKGGEYAKTDFHTDAFFTSNHSQK